MSRLQTDLIKYQSISRDELLRIRVARFAAGETRMLSISSASESAKITHFAPFLVTLILMRLPLSLSKCFRMYQNTRNISKHELLTPNIKESMSV